MMMMKFDGKRKSDNWPVVTLIPCKCNMIKIVIIIIIIVITFLDFIPINLTLQYNVKPHYQR